MQVSPHFINVFISRIRGTSLEIQWANRHRQRVPKWQTRAQPMLLNRLGVWTH